MSDTIEATFLQETGSALVRTNSHALTPVQTIDEAVRLRRDIIEFTRQIMVENKDFGCIPGTDKPTLLKPGAEKLCTHFGLHDSFDIIESIQDWTGTEHGGEPFFSYTIRCRLSKNGETVSEGVGHCNSWEKKYRYRSVYANKATEEEKRTGKLVSKQGRNGTYAVVLLPNDDIFDQINTFLKMAKKRALIDATLRAVSASEFYTQDVEDLAPSPEPQTPAPPSPTPTVEELDQRETVSLKKEFVSLTAQLGHEWPETENGKEDRRHFVSVLAGRAVKSLNDLTLAEWRKVVNELRNQLPRETAGAA